MAGKVSRGSDNRWRIGCTVSSFASKLHFTFKSLVFFSFWKRIIAHSRGYDAYVGKLYQKEIDFIAQRGSEKIYIQVSDNISEKGNFERECFLLLQIRDAYPKMIVARTRHPKYSYEGSEIYDIVDWLLQE